MSDPYGVDLKLRFDREGADLALSGSGDVETISGVENLAQAIVCRIKTVLGELAELGHPDYGSRIYEFMGMPNNERTRRLIRGAVLECLGGEDRVSEVIEIRVVPHRLESEAVVVEVSVLTVGGEVLGVSLPISLEVY